MNSTRQSWPERQTRFRPFRFVNRRTAFLVVGALMLAIGAALNWDWLIAVGIGPIVLSLLPCAVMCLLGVCMHKGKLDANDIAKGGKSQAPLKTGE
jgi:hypothetical protein